MYANYADGISDIKLTANDGVYTAGNTIKYSYVAQSYVDKGMDKFSTLAHEYGHYFDAKANFDGLHFTERNAIINGLQYGGIVVGRNEVASISDEFLEGVRKDKQSWIGKLTNDLRDAIRSTEASSGVQDALDGMFHTQDKNIFKWGHGDKYYNRKYNNCKKMNETSELKNVYKQLGKQVSNQNQVKEIVRDYETASELWANLSSAEVCQGKELEEFKKYLPNSYQAFQEIMKKVK